MIHVIVEVVTVRGVPLPAVVTLDAKSSLVPGKSLALKQTAPTRFEGDLPEGTDLGLGITADSPDFWPATGGLSLSFSDPTTAKALPGGPITRLTWERNSGTVLRVQMVLQKIMDVTGDAQGGFGSPEKCWQFDDVVLNPGGSGATLMNGAEKSTPVVTSNLRIVKWKKGGNRVAIYVPSKAAATLGSYNLFFKPPKHGGWDSIGILGLYMIWNGDRAHKNMVAQVESSGSGYVFCLAFSEDGPLPSYGDSGAGALELIEEIDFLLRRRLPPGPGPTMKVDRVALSGFSAGGDHVESIFGTPDPGLTNKLTGLFLTDAHLNSGNWSKFAADVSTWFGGGGEKAIRIYTSEGKFRGIVDGRTGTTTQGAAGAYEFRSSLQNAAGEPSVIYLNLPVAFYTTFDKWFSNDWQAVHQAIPKMFLGHAHKTSGF